MNNHLLSFSIIHIHPQSFTFIHNHLHSFTITYIQILTVIFFKFRKMIFQGMMLKLRNWGSFVKIKDLQLKQRKENGEALSERTTWTALNIILKIVKRNIEQRRSCENMVFGSFVYPPTIRSWTLLVSYFWNWIIIFSVPPPLDN